MFWEIFEKLCKEKGMSPNAVAKDLSIASGTVTEWKKGKRTPQNATLKKIAEYFNVSVNYLLERKEKALPEKEELKTDSESLSSLKKLLDLYNELNTEGQEKLVSYADDLVTSGKYSTFKIYRAAHSDTNNPAEIKNVGKEFVKALEEAPETDEKF